jgi:hypothetical protein
MERRIRSPNYPALSLPDALNRVTKLYEANHRHPAPREIVARGMGYNTLNGASATAISALQKYGLLDRDGDELRVSERAIKILNPLSLSERCEAIRQAANEPHLFAELNERFPGQRPTDDLLRNYLIRRGFAPSAVTAVIAAYRETSEMAAEAKDADDSMQDHLQEHATMPPTVAPTPDNNPPQLARPQGGKTPVIAMMEDHFIVNTVVRSRAKARLLKRMIEMAEGMLPEDELPADDAGKAAVNAAAEPKTGAVAITDGTQRLSTTLSLPRSSLD